MNIADGIDGLAVVPAAFAVAVYGAFAYVASHARIAEFLIFPFMPGAGEVAVVSDPVDAVKDTDVVYTDVWSSMGQEDERTQRQQDFVGYQVNAAMMRHAPDAIFLHCLPARRGEEVSADVIDGSQSRIVLQAANRLHAQKAVLTWILGMS